MRNTINLYITRTADGLCVTAVDNAEFTDLCATVAMIRRTWQLPQTDVLYVAHRDIPRADVRAAVADY